MRTHRRPTLSHSALLLALVLALAASSACSSSRNAEAGAEPKSSTYFIFDTVVTVKVFDDKVNDAHFEAIGDLLHEIDRQMSRTLDSSELFAVNRNAGVRPVSVSSVTFELVNKALAFAERSEGRFDPTIAPLVDLWGIGEEGAARPSEEDIASRLALVDYRQVRLDESSTSIYLPQAGMGLDLGAIAKGYAADRIAAYLRSEGFDSALIDLGGNVLAMGEKPGGTPWIIGIQAPDDPRGITIGSIKLRDRTVVTSGVYERYFIEDGVRYHHILDTRTGFPVMNELDSVTIVTASSTDADALSTTVFALGLERGMAFVEHLDGTDAVFITPHRDVYVTNGLKDSFELTDGNYEWRNEP